MAQWSKLPLAMPAPHFQVQITVPAVPLPIQLAAKAAWEPADDGSGAQSPPSMWKKEWNFRLWLGLALLVANT